MTWFFLSLSSVFAVASAELVQQKILNHENPLSPRTSSTLGYLCQSLMILPFAYFLYSNQFFVIFSSESLVKFLAVTVIGSIATVFYLKSFRVKNISLSGLFGSLSVVVSTSLGIYFFAEAISALKFIGIFLILLAIISLNFKNTVLEKNHFYGILAGALFGICYVLDKGIVINLPPIVYVFWNFLFLSIFCFLANPNEVLQSVKNKPTAVYKWVIVSGICYLLYNILTFTSYVFGGEVGKVDAINNTQIFIIILFEYFILKHRELVGRKFVTAVVAFAGIFLLGVYN